jgi:hypothetical protein
MWLVVHVQEDARARNVVHELIKARELRLHGVTEVFKADVGLGFGFGLIATVL